MCTKAKRSANSDKINIQERIKKRCFHDWRTYGIKRAARSRVTSDSHTSFLIEQIKISVPAEGHDEHTDQHKSSGTTQPSACSRVRAPQSNTGISAWNSLAFEDGSNTQNYLPGKPTLGRKPELREVRIRAQ